MSGMQPFLAVAVGAAFVFSGCVGLGSDEGLLIIGDPRTSGLSEWPGIFSGPMATYDLNGDGHLEIIAHSTDRKVYVFSSQTGKALAVLPTTYPPAWYIDQILNGVRVAVLEPGDPPSILIANHASYITAWKFLPDESRKDRFEFEKSWEVRTTQCYRHPGNDSDAVPADLTGDGKMEILVHTEEQGLYALNSDGTTLWSHCWAGGNGPAAVGDLNGDGRLEAVFVGDSGFLSVFDGATGNPIWTLDATKYGVTPASAPVAPTLADITGDGRLEVLFTARHAPEDDPDKFGEFNMGIFAARMDPETYQGEVLWMRQPEWANPLSYTHLVVMDVDGDGKADIFGMDWNTIGHRPGNWENLGPANVFRLDAEGNDVWRREIDAWWSNNDIAIADVDGDGFVDIVVTGHRGGIDGFWRLDPENGRSMGWVGVAGWQVQGGPNFLDVRGDGKMQLAYRVIPDEGPPNRGAIILKELDVPYNAPEPGYG
jgi:hypothetical protein